MKKLNERKNPLLVLEVEDLEERELIEKELQRRRISLKFPPQLEKTYHEYHFHNTLGFMKFSLILGFLFFIGFAPLDYLVYPDAYLKLWFIRAAIGVPALLISIMIFHRARRDEVVQATYSLAILAVGMGSILMLLTTSHDITQKYYAGLIITVYYGYVVSGMRFWYATFAGTSITAAYTATVHLLFKPDPAFLATNLFFLAAANFTGMLGNFLLEVSKRKDFLQSALLSFQRRRLEEANRELKRLSNTDALTGLANRRYLEEFLQREWQHAIRYRYPLSVLIIDIDFFKNYNDHLGHQAGDRCLQRLAEVLRDFQRRPGDLAARLGGEEFVVVLSGTDEAGAEKIAEEIRKKVLALKILHPSSEVSVYVSVSIGGASVVPSVDASKESLIEMADRAMYRAKQLGRNRSII